MKKLMFAAAAIAAGVAMAEVKSSNIVGYAKNDTINGFTVVTPQFKNIGNANFSLLNFNPGEAMYDNLGINVIDESGVPLHTYTWTAYADDGTERYDLCGWADDDFLIVTDPAAIEFLPGEAVMLSAGEGAITGSGEVRQAPTSLQLRNGFTVAGNPFPVEYKVQDITPYCEAGIDATYDMLGINLIDESGIPLHTYTWTAYADDGTERYDLCGWADDDYLLINDDNDIKLAAGEGFLVSGSSDEHWLTFPVPESLTPDAE